MKRIQLLDLVRRQLADTAVASRIGEDSLPEVGIGNNAKRWRFGSVAPPLIVQEIKNTVLLDGTAHGSAEDVADQFLPGYARRIIEETIGRRNRVAMVLIKRPVQVVGATLGNQ